MDYRLTANADVDLINKTIKANGTNEYGDPLFRVVFSDDQVERRLGNFTDTHGGLFVRQVTEVREVRKYPWIKEKWILERWASGELAAHKDLREVKNGVYICVYVFQDPKQEYLPPLLKVAEIVINNLLNPRRQAEALQEDQKVWDKKEEDELNKIEEEIKIGSDISKTEDPKSVKETMSVGYAKDQIGEENE